MSEVFSNYLCIQVLTFAWDVLCNVNVVASLALLLALPPYKPDSALWGWLWFSFLHVPWFLPFLSFSWMSPTNPSSLCSGTSPWLPQPKLDWWLLLCLSLLEPVLASITEHSNCLFKTY